MLGIYVTIPVACFRKGQAREYLETEVLPPPSTCYGFLLSLVGETDRMRHLGCRVTAGRFGNDPPSVVLRTVWRVKNKPLGSSGNTRPDFQQLLTDVRLLIWVDSSDEESQESNLEERIQTALSSPDTVCRFGGLSLGESTHLVNDVSVFDVDQQAAQPDSDYLVFLENSRGRLTLPVWVDHVGSTGTVYVSGDLESADTSPPDYGRIPQIRNVQQV